MNMNFKLLVIPVISWLTPMSANANSPSSMNSSGINISGHYLNNHGANENTLAIKELPNNKIQFAMDSVWISNAKTGAVNTGGAKGTIPLQNNKAIYKQGRLILNFSFTGAGCLVKCNDNAQYGGMGVDPNGFYKRKDKTMPSSSELNSPY